MSPPAEPTDDCDAAAAVTFAATATLERSGDCRTTQAMAGNDDDGDGAGGLTAAAAAKATKAMDKNTRQLCNDSARHCWPRLQLQPCGLGFLPLHLPGQEQHNAELASNYKPTPS